MLAWDRTIAEQKADLPTDTSRHIELSYATVTPTFPFELFLTYVMQRYLSLLFNFVFFNA
jgi:hypothetical protein